MLTPVDTILKPYPGSSRVQVVLRKTNTYLKGLNLLVFETKMLINTEPEVSVQNGSIRDGFS